MVASSWRLRCCVRSKPNARAASTVGGVAGKPSAPRPADSTVSEGSRAARRARRAAAANGDRHWLAVAEHEDHCADFQARPEIPRSGITDDVHPERRRPARAAAWSMARPLNGSIHPARLVDAPALGHVDRHLDTIGLKRRLVTHRDVVPAVVQRDVARELRVDGGAGVCRRSACRASRRCDRVRFRATP